MGTPKWRVKKYVTFINFLLNIERLALNMESFDVKFNFTSIDVLHKA